MKKKLMSQSILGLMLISVFLMRIDTGMVLAQKPIELKMVTISGEGHPEWIGLKMYIDRLNEAAKGELVLKWVGSAEVIKSLDQPEAVIRGVIDATQTQAGYYRKMLPEANVHSYSRFGPLEERTSGFYDLMVNLHKEKNLRYIGRGTSPNPYYLFINKMVAKPLDFKGIRMRGVSSYKPMFNQLNATMVTMPVRDTYSAMDRGLVDGFALPLPSTVKYKLYEVTKYCLDHGFRKQYSQVLLLNLDKWNQIPKHLQDLMINTYWEVRPKWDAYCQQELGDKIKKKLTAAGMEFIKFSEADEKWFLDMVYNSGWEDMKKSIRPEYYQELRKMTGN